MPRWEESRGFTASGQTFAPVQQGAQATSPRLTGGLMATVSVRGVEDRGKAGIDRAAQAAPRACR